MTLTAAINDLSIKKKLITIVTVFTFSIVAILGIVYFAIDALSTVRAYVGGEGLWSKGQKDALYHLTRYATSHDPEDFRKYRELLQAPLGDKDARLELEKGRSDFSISDQGFIRGGNHPSEVRAMGLLFKRFRHLSYIDRAVQIWTKADGEIANLELVANELHDQVIAGKLDPLEQRRIFKKIDALNAVLTEYEVQFSYTLGEAARWLKSILVFAIILVTVCVLGLGLSVAFLISHKILTSVTEIQTGTKRISQGDFKQPIHVSSKDELGQLAVSFNQMAENLVETIDELHETKKKAVLSAHQSGMAEIATEILHNIGNLLNSVNINAETMQRIVSQSEVKSLLKANEMLKENLPSIARFLSEDKRGKGLPDFYVIVGESLANESKVLDRELQGLLKGIKLIKDVISSQQTYAKGIEFREEVYLTDAIETTLMMMSNSLARHDIQVTRKISNVAPIEAQSAKLVHVLVNLVKNAKEALRTGDGKVKELVIETGTEADGQIFIKITDNGEGIPKENLEKIFSHGFTTKKSGFGFGLHFCANAINELGGKLTVASEGRGKGATFSIHFENKNAKKLAAS